MLSGERKESSRVASKAKCRETTTSPSTSSSDCNRYHSLSDWSKLAFSLSERSSCENRTLCRSLAGRCEKRHIKINTTVAFSLGAHNDQIIFAKSTRFPGRRDGWKEIGVMFKRYPECGVNKWCIWRCDGIVRCVRKHGV